MNLLRVASAIALLFAPPAVWAQSTGTVNLVGPSTNPGSPQVTPATINAAVNTALGAKADASGGILTSPTLVNAALSGGLSGSPVVSDPWTFSGGLSGTLTGAASLNLLLTGGTLSGALHMGANTLDGSAVAFTGGTVDGVAIGGTTRAAGAFTTLGANGLASFTGAGTALSVTNNATIGGTLGVTGSATFSTVLGSSNLTIAPSSSSSVVNFKASAAGASLVQIGGTSGNIAVQTGAYLSLPAKPWSGGGIQGNAALYSNGTWTGSTGGADAQLFFLQAADSIDTGAGKSVNLLAINQNVSGTGWTGNRGPLVVTLGITAAPTTANNGAFTAGRTQVTANVNVGGTAPTPAGTAFGFNAVSHLQSGATFWAGAIGAELDYQVDTGASVQDKIGLLVNALSGDAVQGSRDDIALAIGRSDAPTSTTGASVGLSFGVQAGAFPVSTVGTLIGGEGHLGISWTVGNGIDWHLGTVTGKWLNLGGVFTVDATGNEVALSVQTTPIAVASLPTCNSGTKGVWRSVSDANSTTYNATAAGSGSNVMPVFCNGTNWTLH